MTPRQRKQRSFDDSHWIYRWTITDTSGRQFITWAPTKGMATKRARERQIAIDRIVASCDKPGECTLPQLPDAPAVIG